MKIQENDKHITAGSEVQSTLMGIIGAGEVGGQIARAAVASGYRMVIANSRRSETLKNLILELGPMARVATAKEAAAAGDFVVVAVRLKLENDMPVEELAGKIVIDTNNYMSYRDGRFPMIDSGEKTNPDLITNVIVGCNPLL